MEHDRQLCTSNRSNTALLLFASASLQQLFCIIIPPSVALVKPIIFIHAHCLALRRLDLSLASANILQASNVFLIFNGYAHLESSHIDLTNGNAGRIGHILNHGNAPVKQFDRKNCFSVLYRSLETLVFIIVIFHILLSMYCNVLLLYSYCNQADY